MNEKTLKVVTRTTSVLKLTSALCELTASVLGIVIAVREFKKSLAVKKVKTEVETVSEEKAE